MASLGGRPGHRTRDSHIPPRRTVPIGPYVPLGLSGRASAVSHTHGRRISRAALATLESLHVCGHARLFKYSGGLFLPAHCDIGADKRGHWTSGPLDTRMGTGPTCHSRRSSHAVASSYARTPAGCRHNRRTGLCAGRLFRGPNGTSRRSERSRLVASRVVVRSPHSSGGWPPVVRGTRVQCIHGGSRRTASGSSCRRHLKRAPCDHPVVSSLSL